MSRISRFSPNWSNPDDLEAITVARESLIAGAVDSARESALTKNKHHRLFIGARGSGKTHLITVVRHRLVQMDDLNDTLRIAWLNEDETSDTLLSLLLKVYRSLSREYPVEFPVDLTEAVFDLEDIQEATREITELLLKQLKDKTVLLLIENLDALFHIFGEAEQKSWRALIQNHPQFCTIATAQRLFHGVSSRSAPFFGFFQIEHLKPFSVTEAAELFTKVANVRKDEELEQFITLPRGRARIRALHHLIGGNQRLFIILSEFINRDSLDSLVEPFEELVDEQLTPYYQERLRWISPLQRRIVEYLCAVVKPEPVKVIAHRLFSTSQTISKQLQELRKLGYVISRLRGRESFYELAEPLMRLSYQVKEARGRSPLRLLVDFLRVWYDQQELLERMKLVDGDASLTRNYLSAAIMLHEIEGSLRLRYFQEDANEIDLMNCSDDQVELLRDLMEESGNPMDFLRYGKAQLDRSRFKEALSAFTEVVAMDKVPVDLLATALNLRAFIYAKMGDSKSVITECTKVIKLNKISSDNRAFAHGFRALEYYLSGNAEAAISDYSVAIDLKVTENQITSGAHFGLAEVLMWRGDWGRANRHLNKGFELAKDYSRVNGFPYVEAVLASGRSISAWKHRVDFLVDAFAKYSAANLLGSGLTLSISFLQNSNLSAEMMREWCSIWEEQAQKHQGLELPGRLLRTAVDFFTAKEDVSVLLNLPKEERLVLAKILKLDIKETE